MKLFLISNMYPTADNPGYGSFVKNAADSLENYGVNTSVMAVIRGRASSKFSKLKKYLKFYKDIAIGFFKNYDSIYIHFPNQAIPLLSILFKFKKRKVILNFHGEDLLYEPTGYTGRLGRLTEDFCRRYATAIIVPSEYFRNLASDCRLADSSRIFVSPSGGLNPDIFYPSKKFHGENITRPLHLGYIGRMDPGKGIEKFLHVLAILNKRGFDFKATAIGYGSLFGYAREFIAANSLSAKTTLIEGVPQNELQRYYSDMDLLIFLSDRDQESLGLTGIEAMACGTPVIGTDVGGIASYLDDGRNGFMAHRSDPADVIADLIEKYVSMPEREKDEMKANCIATAAPYKSDIVIKKLSEIFKTLIPETK